MTATRTILAVTAALALPVCVFAAKEDNATVPRPRFNFTLVPKPFQKNPQLEMTVFTVVTKFGQTLPRATPENPIHFVVQTKDAMELGIGVAGERKPMRKDLEDVLYFTLEEQGLLPARDGGPQPRLVLVFHWGSHNRLDLELATMFPELHREQMLERAMLVGGPAYRKEVDRIFDWGPLPKDRTPKMRALYDQANSGLYYAIVSAYDFESVAHDEPRLAWRTTMTVTSTGLAMKEALPPLVATAGDFFGREMDEPSAIWRNVRIGTVEMGPLRYIGEVDESEVPESK
jgi:hypothetical protein